MFPPRNTYSESHRIPEPFLLLPPCDGPSYYSIVSSAPTPTPYDDPSH
jgi:hypothetical protein